MTTTIVTLPTSVSSGLPYFPTSAFSMLTLEVPREIAFENQISRAASGREVGVSWRELPTITFELNWGGVDDNDANIPQSQTGAETFTEYDTLIGFYEQQHGSLLPFYLRLSELTHKPQDSFVQGQQIATGDGTTANFQLCRTVGPYLEPIQMVDPAGQLVVYVNGAPTTAFTLLTAGIVQFTAAPAANAVITADIPWVYLCRFDSDDMTTRQWAQYIHDAEALKIRTVIQ